MLHVRFEGRSLEFGGFNTAQLQGMTDGDIKMAAAAQLDVAAERLRHHVVDRAPGGQVILRPQAVYG